MWTTYSSFLNNVAIVYLLYKVWYWLNGGLTDYGFLRLSSIKMGDKMDWKICPESQTEKRMKVSYYR